MLAPPADTPFQIHLSFDYVFQHLEQVAASATSPEAIEARALLQEAAPFPELKEGITDIAQLQANKALISRLLAGHFPPALTINEIKAASLPYMGVIFNHTQRFKNLLAAAGPGFAINIRDFDAHQFYVNSCCLILNQFYGTRLDFAKPLFYDIPTAEGVTRHYRILYNGDFLEILPTGKSLTLSPEDIDQLINNYDDLSLWKQKFPKESWLLKGFALMTLYDATVENAVSLLKDKFLGLTATGFQQTVESVFQSIYRMREVKIGFTLFNQEDGRLGIAPFGQPLPSFLLPQHQPADAQAVLCSLSYRNLVQKKVYFPVSDTDEFARQNPDSELARLFLAQEIGSFILAPIVKNGLLLGILEVVSPRPKALNSINANKLEVVMPFLTDTIERLVAELQNQVQAVIQDNYTRLHASVSWKFKAEALRLIQARQQGRKYTLREITFPEVYPLYGQIDVKGSSEARNDSVRKDLQKQLTALQRVLEEITRRDLGEPFEEEVRQVEQFLRELSLPIKTSTEQGIQSYLERRLHARFRQMDAPELQPLLQAYLQATNKQTGDFHTYRRRYENSLSWINEAMVSVLDAQQPAMQAKLPHYYERFKSDGVEHTLYAGASIPAGHAFLVEDLYALRQWQLEVMWEMENTHHHLKHALSYPLEVTSLLLVHNAPIGIRFRMDEKRFDVDGSYNTRYEIIKKRIDKARIKNTPHRITETGKITIVYSDDRDAREYAQYIALLQSRNQLEKDIEQFEVEELQGVSGLKALRVKIIYSRLAEE